jgi:hypothetical protein
MSFNFNQDLVLEDEGYYFVHFKNSDVEHLLEISLNEPETWEYSSEGKRKRKLDQLYSISYSGKRK